MKTKNLPLKNAFIEKEKKSRVLNTITLFIAVLGFTLTSNSLIAQTVDLESDLYAHYKFNGTFADAQGNMSTLAPISNSGTPGYREDHYGIPLGSVNMGSTTIATNGYNNSSVTDEFSVQAWLMPKATLNAATSQSLIYEHYITSAMYYRTGKIYFEYHDAGGSRRIFSHTIDFLQDVWVHLVATVKNNGDVILYIDGSPTTLATATTGFRAISQTFFVGGAGDAVGQPIDRFNGLIDELRFYARELNTNEVDALMNLAELPPVEGSTIADLTLEEDFDLIQVAALDTIYSDPENRALYYRAVVDSGLVASMNADTLELTALENFNGVANVTIYATDSANAISQTFAVTINPVDDTPAFGFEANEVVLDNTFGDSTIQIVSFHPVDEEAVTYSIDPDPATIDFVGMTFDTNSGQIDLSSIDFESGSQAFLVTASDGVGADFDSVFSITINQAFFNVMNTNIKSNQIRFDPTGNIGISFDENIATNFDGSGIRLSGSQSGLIAFTLSGQGTDSLVIDPTADFFPNELITVNLFGVPSESGALAQKVIQFNAGLTIEGASGTVSFEQNMLSTDLQSPRRVVPVDLDQDGDLDIVTPFLSSNTIAWYENESELNFTRHTIIDNQTGVINSKVEDIDGDGDLDIVAYNLTDLDVYWLQNDGSQNFTKQPIGSGIEDARGIDLADIDQDGDIDIVQAYRTADEVHIWINDGAGNFSDLLVRSSINDIIRVFVRDFEHDGDLDILCLELATGTLRWLVNDGEENFSLVTHNSNFTGRNVYDAVPIDYNGDGDLDVWQPRENHSNFASGFVIQYDNNGSNSYTQRAYNFPIRGNRTFAIGDLDADGSMDLAFGNHRNTELGWGGISGNNITMTSITSTVNGVFDMKNADFDGDGDLDLVVSGLTNHGVAVFNNKLINLVPELTNPIADVYVDEDAEPTVIDLTDVFTSTFPLTYTATSNQTGVVPSIDGNTLTLTYEANYDGLAEVTVVASDGSKTAEDLFEVGVSSVEDAPILLAGMTFELLEDQTTSFDLDTMFFDADGDAIEYYNFDTDLPMTFSLSGSILTFVPEADQFGVGTLEMSTYDQMHEGDYTIPAEIISVNDAPSFTLSETEISIGQNFENTLSVTLSDESPANESSQTVSYSIDPATVSFADISFSNTTGELTIDAITDGFGTQDFIISSDDGQSENNTFSTTFTLTILENQPPTIVSAIPDASLNEDESIVLSSDITTVFTDPDGDVLTYSAESDNAGIIPSITDNELSIELISDFNGTAIVSLIANDGSNTTADEIVITVNPVNDTPTFTLSGDVNVDEDFIDPVIVSVTQMQPANEADQLLNYTMSPATVEFATVSINAETGEITIESVADAFGTQEFTVSVDDGENENNTASSTFTLTVNSINDLVGLSASNGSYQEDFTGEQVISIDATHPANESDQTITYSIAPATESVDFASIVFDETSLTLTTTAVADGFGSQVFTISANDGIETSTIDVTVEVTSVNDAPDFELSTTALTLGQDFNGTQSITLTDLSPANESETITYSLDPATVSFANISFDTQTGTTSISSVNGGTGNQTFTISASDGDLDISNTFFLEVLANQAPTVVVAIDDQTFEEDAAIQTIDSDITDNFSDPDGDDLTFGVSTDNSNVTASLDGNQLKVELAANFFGTAIVSLTATDATLSTIDEFTVNVTSVNDTPVLEVSISDVSTDEDASFTYSIPINTFSDVEDGTPVVSATVPDWITFNSSSMMFIGTPTNDEVGTHTVTVTGTDAGGLTVSDDFVVTVVNTNDAPTLVTEISNLVESEDVGSFSIDLSSNFQDVDGDDLTYSITSSHGIFTSSVNGSVINFESVANANGVEAVTLEVTDGTALMTTSFDVELTAVNDAPIFTIDQTELILEPNFSAQSIVITPDAIPTDEQSQAVTYSLSPATVDFATITIDETTGEVTITSITDAEGEATITIIADDGESENATHEVSFSLEVIRVLGVGDELSEAISIYPNPSVNWIQIDVDSDKILESIRIMSVKGEVVEVIDPSLRKIDVSSFKSGVYFLELIDEKEKAVMRFIKE